MFKKIPGLSIALLILMVSENVYSRTGDDATRENEGSEVQTVKQVVVSASRVEEDASMIANDIIVITGEEIKRRKLTTVIDVLRTVPDVTVVQNGAFGGVVSIYLRGVPTGQTLIMVNGMRVFDPMSTDASFNSGHMSTINIERIEILKGPQSVLYGSNAIGGVINIITKKGKGRPEVQVDGSLGSWRTQRGSIETSGSRGPLAYAISASGLSTDGISKANERENQGERDFYKSYNFDTRLDWDLTEYTSTGMEFRYNYGWFKFDDGANQDDPDRYGDSESILFSSYLDAVPFEWWKSTASFAVLRYRRKDMDVTDDRDSEDSHSFFHGKDFKFGWQNTFFIHQFNTLTTGLEFEHERGNSGSHFDSSGWASQSTISTKYNDTKSFFINNVFQWKGLYLTTGLRYDHHSRWGTNNTHRIAAAYNFDWGKLNELNPRWKNIDWLSDMDLKTKIRGSYATGFKSPSIYQLYSPYGKSDLKPEESWGWEIGIEQNIIGNKLFAELTYFDMDIKNLINYIFATNSYDNDGSAEISGYEVSFSVVPIDEVRIKGGYTYYTKLNNKITDEWLVRRPESKFNINLDWQVFTFDIYKDKSFWGRLNFDTSYSGNRWDKVGFPLQWEPLQSYWKFDLLMELGITEHLSLYYKIDNLTDRFYEEVYGYATPPRNHTIGFKTNIAF